MTTSESTTADDDYTIKSADIDLDASKSFDPDTIAAGSDSTVTIGATNSSDRTLTPSRHRARRSAEHVRERLDVLRLGRPCSGRIGATGATVSFSYCEPTVTGRGDADAANTLPDPTPAGTVTGFTVEFTGPITPGPRHDPVRP